MSKTNVAIQERVDLPSGGILYGGEVPATITLRAMTAKEEKQRTGGHGIATIPMLIKSCCVEPKDINTDIMVMADIHYLMYRLRVITYGAEYKPMIQCPACGGWFTINVDLDKLPIDLLTEELDTTIGPLPVSKDTLEIKLLTAGDMTYIEDERRRRQQKFPGSEDPRFELERSLRILTINGEEKAPAQLEKYVSNMHAKDLLFFDRKSNELNSKFGMDLFRIDKCIHCANNVQHLLSTTEEFFRPTI